MPATTNIAAGLDLARELLEGDCSAFVECGAGTLYGLPPDDQIIANSYAAAMAAVDAAALALQRLQAERDALAERQLVLGGEASALLWAARQIAASVGLGPDASLNEIVAAVKSLAAPQPPAADHPEDALEMVRTPAAKPARQPLTREQIDGIMTEHYPISSLNREDVDAFEACVRDIERANGIGTEPSQEGGAA